MGAGKHVVYMLKCKDETLYTGYTNDLTRRINMHTAGKGAKYTRGRGPFKVVYKESYATKTEAMKREYQIKQLSRTEKKKLIDRQINEVSSNEDPKEF